MDDAPRYENLKYLNKKLYSVRYSHLHHNIIIYIYIYILRTENSYLKI